MHTFWRKCRLAVAPVLAVAIGASAQIAPPASRANTLRPFASADEFEAFLRAHTRDNDFACPLGRDSFAPKEDSAAAGAIGDSMEIRGVVMSQAGRALNGATVFADELHLHVQSDSAGKYRLVIPRSRLSQSPTLKLGARLIGFRQRVSRISPAPGERATRNFVLCPLPIVLGPGFIYDGPAWPSYAAQSGVQFGDLLQESGDHLLLLQNARLFSLPTSRSATHPTSTVDPFGTGSEWQERWFGLYVLGDRVLAAVSSRGEGIQIRDLRLDGAGRLHPGAVYRLHATEADSSWRLRAIALVGHRLVIYEDRVVHWNDEQLFAAPPGLRRSSNVADVGHAKFVPMAQRYYAPPLQPEVGDSVALHSISTCDLTAREINCASTIVAGLPGLELFFSRSAVYLWTSAATGKIKGSLRLLTDSAAVALVRIPLDHSPPTALGVTGRPVDAAAFLESADGYLNVLVRGDSVGSTFATSNAVLGRIALLRVPLASFGNGAQAAPLDDYRPLPGKSDERVQERFVGDYLLYGAGNGFGTRHRSRAVLYSVPWRGGPLDSIELDHTVDRIEPMAAGAVVFGLDSAGLQVSEIHLASPLAIATRLTMDSASLGDAVLEGSLFSDRGSSAGVLALAIVGLGSHGYGLPEEPSKLALIMLRDSSGLRRTGLLAGTPDSTRADWCELPLCADWYSRPRFIGLDGRLFTLFGTELVEVAVRGGKLVEIHRVNFAPRPVIKQR